MKVKSKEPCPICDSNPCMGICPTQDRFGGDQEAEDRDFEMGRSDVDADERIYDEE